MRTIYYHVCKGFIKGIKINVIKDNKEECQFRGTKRWKEVKVK